MEIYFQKQNNFEPRVFKEKCDSATVYTRCSYIILRGEKHVYLKILLFWPLDLPYNTFFFFFLFFFLNKIDIFSATEPQSSV